MKKWLFPLAAAGIVVIGCGGSGSSTSTTSATTGTVSGDSVATANLPSGPALVDFSYLTGQGRAVGDVLANIQEVFLSDSTGTDVNRLQDNRSLGLNEYTYQIVSLNVPEIPNGNSRTFSTYDLQVASLQTVNADGSFSSPVTGPNNTFAVDQSFPAAIAAFPGRLSQVQVYLDDASLNPNNAPFFDRTLFLQNNTTTDNPNITSFLSDYVAFNIKGVAAKPNLSTGSPAQVVYFSGDKIALSDALPSATTPQATFEVFTPGNPLDGIVVAPGKAPSSNPGQNITPTSLPGTYSLREPDPRDLTFRMKITSLLGTWINWYDPTNINEQAVSKPGTFEVMLMPHSADDNMQDIVAVVEDTNANISNMYFGVADLNAKTFTVYPIANVETGDISGAINGTFTALQDGTGAATTVPASVRQGRYSITGTLPTGFRATGRFFTYRR